MARAFDPMLARDRHLLFNYVSQHIAAGLLLAGRSRR